MSNLLIIIGCIVMVGSFYWLHEIIKARYVVRKFFKKAVEVQELYNLYTLSEQGRIGKEIVKVSFELKVTVEDVEYILDLEEETISYCDKYCLRDFEEPIIEQTYDNLRKIGTEIRRWLWVNQ